MNLRLRGGPANGYEVDVGDGSSIKYIRVPVPDVGGFGQARYIIERVEGKPVYGQFIPPRGLLK